MEWYRLKLEGLKNSKIRILMNNYIKYKDIFVNLESIKFDLKFSDEEIKQILNSKNNLKFIELKSILNKERITLLSLNDYRYSPLLQNINKPPLFLFCKGDISLLKCEKIISVVGTRRPTEYGKYCCEKIVKSLVEANICIVSGLALGIDSLAHKKSLEISGKTIAVLGCGIDKIYPKTNRSLREEIEEKGLVITEFPLGTLSKPINFPVRNRIIAGLSRGTVVVESSIKSGSLITANLAFEEGRDVFAIPGDITSEFSEGCNQLIKTQQAKLISEAEDILIEYGWKSENKSSKILNLSPEKLQFYEILKTKLSLDEIKAKIPLKTPTLLSYLMELEIEGIIKSLPGGFYQRIEK